MRPLHLANSRNARVSGGAGLGLALEGLECKLELECPGAREQGRPARAHVWFPHLPALNPHTRRCGSRNMLQASIPH